MQEQSKGLYKLQKENIVIVECNLNNISNIPNLIKDRDIDVIYHFAWQGVWGNDLKDENIQLANIYATLELIYAAYEMKIKAFIGAGSIHESELIFEMCENKTITNMGIMYKTSKLAAHYMAKAKAGNLGIKFFWPIITNAYGIGENSGRLVNTVIRKIFNGQVPDLSEGYQNYDFIYIDDVSNAFYLIGERGIDGTNYIIGSGIVKPLKEYIQIVGDIANSYIHSNIKLGFGNINTNAVFLPEYCFDISQLEKDTGFTPCVSFEEGIRITVDWIFHNHNKYL